MKNKFTISVAIVFLVMIISNIGLAISFASNSLSQEEQDKCIEDAIDYFGVFGFTFYGPNDTPENSKDVYRILACYAKRDTINKEQGVYSDYGVSFITKAGVHTTLLFNKVPNDFNIWDTEIAIRDGRVTVIGAAHDSHNVWNLIFNRYKEFVVAISGFGILCCILALIFDFMKIGTYASNPGQRSRVLMGFFYTGLGLAGLGSIMLIFGFFWNLI